MRIAVAVHDTPIWTLPDGELSYIRTRLPDHDVVDARRLEDRAAAFRSADVLVTTWLSEAEASALDRVRWIHSTAVGADGVLKPGVASRGIVVTNSRGVHADPIAEHAIALSLALRRGLHVAHARQREGVWAPEELYDQRGPSLGESCLLVVGLGAIGSRVAALAGALGMRVIGVRKRVGLPHPAGVSAVHDASELRAVLPEADIVVLAAPYTGGTRELIGAGELAAMKATAVLVNVARGALVDEDALVAALSSGRIAGAGLDAFAREPLPPDSPFWRLPNVLVTPHSASFRRDYWRPVVDLFLGNMGRFRRGEPLVNQVDPTLGY